ncbi:MAG: hypothetical protein IPI66_07795 [Chitinophagaceae bacterium]|nr:hypothetical protein [Chitinophagaceae bacterium]
MSARQTAKNLLDAILGNAINIYGTGYMLRSRVYDEVGGIPLYPNLLSADYVLWLKVAALAYISTSPKTCFAYRINQSTTATTKTDVYIRSLKMFIDYLLRDKDHLSPGEDRNVYATRILTFYCQRVSRRLLTAGLKDRDGVTVKRFAAETKEYARSFLDEGHFFDPGRIRDVRLAKIVDSNLFTRKLFLLLKKIHPNPLMK